MLRKSIMLSKRCLSAFCHLVTLSPCHFVIICLLAVGCQQPAESPQAKAKEAPAEAGPKLTVVRPERKTVHRPIKRPGYNIEAYQSTPLYARISGYVRKWNFDIGDR